VEVLLLGGRSGVGKSSVGFEVSDLPQAAGVAHGLVDDDNLARSRCATGYQAHAPKPALGTRTNVRVVSGMVLPSRRAAPARCAGVRKVTSGTGAEEGDRRGPAGTGGVPRRVVRLSTPPTCRVFPERDGPEHRCGESDDSC